MKNIAILGSTGSIGCSTLNVIRHNLERYTPYLLAGGKNSQKMVEQCLEFKPSYVVMSDQTAFEEVKKTLAQHKLSTQVFYGEHNLCELVQLPEIDDVMAAIVGAAGLKPTMAAIKKGKRILLANKEALVTCGAIFMNAVKQYQAELLPVDSEHNAIYQSLPLAVQQDLGFASLSEHGIHKIILTGSGGPFRDAPLSKLQNVSVEEAINHPNWSMGPKISVDSATMMNKGLEYIEARWLFNASKEEMEIIVHPQSIIHSMVRYLDGSIIAELGMPDMCTPIAYAMGYPNRIKSSVGHLDFTQISELTFRKPDFQRYPCLKLAIEASESGQAATTVLNAANEVAVDAFLTGRISFLSIADVVDHLLQKQNHSEPRSIEEVEQIDLWTREATSSYLLAH